MNRLALRLGLCGGLLAFAGNALVMFSRDPDFQFTSPAQVMQMSLVWFGFTALVGSVVGWGIWAMTASMEHRRSNGGRTELPAVSLPVAAGGVPAAQQVARAYEAGAAAGPRAPEEGQAEGEASEALRSTPPEQTARAIRQALHE